VERSCQCCGERFEAKRADKIYCSGACKQAAVRARRGVRVARRPPVAQPDELLERLAELEDRQRTILTDLDHLEEQMGGPKANAHVEALSRRIDALEAGLLQMDKVLKTLSSRQRKHEAALTQMAELLATEPWRKR
jgi:chromosome segregation ATPase